MLPRSRADRSILPSEVTPESVWRSRRDFLLRSAGLLPLAVPALSRAAGCEFPVSARAASDEALTSWEDVTGYNNFFEFSTDKKAVKHLAADLRMRPWSVSIEGEVKRPRVWDMEDLLRQFPQEERVLRLRCVEGWSMVVPWQGFSLCALLRQAEPTSNARHVVFTALHDRKQLPGQRSSVLDWPYVEGLTLPEAMHPLTTLATGVYGKPLPPQNGGPIRLVVPWKYGFKSIKCVVRISVETKQPATSWNKRAPEEYGFYANVNPDRPHPRWSQAREVRIGEMRKRQTLPFNGYAAEVAKLYADLDLQASF
jgi:methionine sulfoxide reductase catalytic subunit